MGVLDSIYYMTLKKIKIVFLCANVDILPSFTQRYNGRHNLSRTVAYRFYCIALYHSQTRRHVINVFSIGLDTCLFERKSIIIYIANIFKTSRLFNLKSILIWMHVLVIALSYIYSLTKETQESAMAQW